LSAERTYRDPFWFPGSVHPLLPMSSATWSERPAVTYKVRESFSYDGRPFAKGEVLERDDPVVAPVLKERPELLVGVP
jgi:hypothetical protein